MDIYIGLTREKAIETFERLLAEARASASDTYMDLEVHAEPNLRGGGEVTLRFTNDDMEDRPEMVDRILVDVEP